MEVNMSRFKLKACIKEFPFLSEVLNKYEELILDDINIEMTDQFILDRVPVEAKIINSMNDINEWEAFHLVVEDPNSHQEIILYDCVRPAKSFESSDTSYNKAGETVLESIDRICEEKGWSTSSVKRILFVRGGYNAIDNQSTREFEVNVYLVPKEFSIDEEIKEAEKEALDKLKMQIF